MAPSSTSNREVPGRARRAVTPARGGRRKHRVPVDPEPAVAPPGLLDRTTWFRWIRTYWAFLIFLACAVLIR